MYENEQGAIQSMCKYLFIISSLTNLAEAPRKATLRSASKLSSLAKVLADAPLNDGLNCLIISVNCKNHSSTSFSC